MMTLAQLSDFGQTVGGIAVVASLVYLAIQVRQNTRSVEASTLHQNTELWTTAFLRLADPEIAAAFVAGMRADPDIRPMHYTQFFLLCRAVFLAFENQYYQMQRGVLDPETYAGYQRSISTQFLAFRGFRLWWRQSQSVFSPMFVSHVNAMLADVLEVEPDLFISEWRQLASEHPKSLGSE